MIPETNNIYEKRLVNRLKNYWDLIKEDGEAPLFSKFKGNSMQDIWENCMTFKVIKSGQSHIYQCEHMGDKLKLAFGNDLENKYFATTGLDSKLNSNFMKFLDYAIESSDFVISGGQFVNKQNKVVKYRDCVMPFRDEKGSIKLIVVGVSWRAFG